MRESSVIDEQTVLLDLAAASRDDVIAELGRRLVESGRVDPAYVTAVQEREERFPTGLPTSPVGIAVPHATPGDAVHAWSVAMARLQASVDFGEMGSVDGTVPVQLVFLLAMPEKDQTGVLSRLIATVQDQTAMDTLLHEGSAPIAELLSTRIGSASMP